MSNKCVYKYISLILSIFNIYSSIIISDYHP